jgi:hypothetical protein
MVRQGIGQLVLPRRKEGLTQIRQAMHAEHADAARL